MKYFILYVTYNDDLTHENYLKGPSLDHVEEQIADMQMVVLLQLKELFILQMPNLPSLEK